MFGTSQKLASVEEFRISIGRHQLERVSEFKYLGVVLDETLSWKAHTRYATSKAGKKVGMLGRLTSHAANSIYQAHILPVLEYCDTVWAGCNKQDSDGLERLQRRAARIVMHSKDSDFSMKTLKWETLLERRQKHILSLVNKCLKKKVPQFLMDIFKFNREIISRSTRQSNKLRLPRVRTDSILPLFTEMEENNCSLVFASEVNSTLRAL